MGAINKTTLKYECPKLAKKSHKYKCPSCDKDVIFRNGKIKQPHYAHKKSDNPCYYYDRPSESQIHKDAKMLMKMLLENKTTMSFFRTCNHCDEPKTAHILDITPSLYDNTHAVIEYKFHYNNSNRSADVALIESDNIRYIFEICYKNKTKEENRPEPWLEIDAENLIKYINNKDHQKIEIECKRDYKCECCVNMETLNQQNNYKLLEWMRTKERWMLTKEKEQKEQETEMRELFNMGKEDERTIQKQYKIELEREQERVEIELFNKQMDLEREQERVERERLKKHMDLEREQKLKINKRIEDLCKNIIRKKY
jgi:hypothetical protein